MRLMFFLIAGLSVELVYAGVSVDYYAKINCTGVPNLFSSFFLTTNPVQLPVNYAVPSLYVRISSAKQFINIHDLLNEHQQRLDDFMMSCQSTLRQERFPNPNNVPYPIDWTHFEVNPSFEIKTILTAGLRPLNQPCDTASQCASAFCSTLGACVPMPATLPATEK